MRFMMSFVALAAFAGSVAFAPVPAHADTINFSYTGDGVTATGSFTAAAPVDGVYTVTGMTGTRNGVAITGLDSAGSYQSNDNQLSLAAPYSTIYGISYDVNGIDYNIFTDNGTYTPINGSGECSNCGDDFVPITFTDSLARSSSASPIPEPSSLVLFGTGIIGFAGMTRRRFLRS